MPALGLTEPARADDIAVRGLVVAEGGRLVMISRRSFAAALELLSLLVKLCRMDMIVTREVRLRKGGNLSKLS
jgi:hypothetical protein